MTNEGYSVAKALFAKNRGSLGSRELAKKLNEEGIKGRRGKTRRRMRSLGLYVSQRRSYKVTTWRDRRAGVADNLLNQNFNSVGRRIVG